jgi:hypothetical protein
MKEFIDLGEHGRPRISIMVWGAIWKGGRSHLVIMERDEEAPRNGYSARSYRTALKEGLLPYYQPWMRFMQDNAPIHKEEATMAWFLQHGIELLDWPPHSPDLNPIEHVWKALKQMITKMHPEIRYLKKNQAHIQKLKEWMVEAWYAIEQGHIDNLIDSWPRRLRECIRAKGYYTHY